MSLLGGLVPAVIPSQCVSARSSAREGGRRFSINPEAGDEICCVRIDGCWVQGGNRKRVDYLFVCKSASGKKLVLLVELKGRDFGRALEQIESALEFLCKRTEGNIVHAAASADAPGHDLPEKGGVRAFVILSKGRGVPQRTAERRRLQQRYGVIVYPYGRSLQVDGLDALPG